MKQRSFFQRPDCISIIRPQFVHHVSQSGGGLVLLVQRLLLLLLLISDWSSLQQVWWRLEEAWRRKENKQNKRKIFSLYIFNKMTQKVIIIWRHHSGPVIHWVWGGGLTGFCNTPVWSSEGSSVRLTWRSVPLKAECHRCSSPRASRSRHTKAPASPA